MSSLETKTVAPRRTGPAASSTAPAAPRAAQAKAKVAAPRADGTSAEAARATLQVQGRANTTLQLVPPRDGPRGCARQPAPDDRTRRLVVSHPFDSDGKRAGAFEVLDVATNGTLSRPGRTFTMGSVTAGSIDFTPDGEVGLVALDDGKIGVFRLDADGKPSVVHEGFAGSFSASKVVVEPSGDRALVLDRSWRDKGGGIYQVTIGCDGTLTDHGRILPAKLPGAIAFAGDRIVLAAADESPEQPGVKPTNETVHLLDWSQTPKKLSGANAFGHNEVIVGGAALTSDGKTFLVGDTNAFSGNLNAVAAVTVDGDTVRPSGGVAVDDPAAIATSPFGPVAIVTQPGKDAIRVLDTKGEGGQWRVRGLVPYKGRRPQIPTDVATIDRGELRGTVYVSEASSVRRLAFKPDGSVVDLGSLGFGEGLTSINGAIGVTK